MASDPYGLGQLARRGEERLLRLLTGLDDARRGFDPRPFLGWSTQRPHRILAPE